MSWLLKRRDSSGFGSAGSENKPPAEKLLPGSVQQDLFLSGSSPRTHNLVSWVIGAQRDVLKLPSMPVPRGGLELCHQGGGA